MPGDLFLTLAGGVVGSAATVGFAGLGKLRAARGEVAAHDEQMRALNEDLRLWVADDYRKLRATLAGIEEEMSGRCVRASSIHAGERSEAKTSMLHRYRDQANTARRAVHAIQRSEGWSHRVWRSRDHRPFPAFTAPDDVQFVLDDVRKPTTKPGLESGPVFDPTKFDLEELRQEVQRSPLEPSSSPSLPSGTAPEGDRPAAQP